MDSIDVEKIILQKEAEEIDESVGKITLKKKKPKEVKTVDEIQEITIKKTVVQEEQKTLETSQDTEESIQLIKPKKSIDEDTDQITLKKKKPKEVKTSDVAEEITIKKTVVQEEQLPLETPEEKFTLSKPRKSITEQPEETPVGSYTIKEKPKAIEEDVEKVKTKPRRKKSKPQITEESEEQLIKIIKPRKSIDESKLN